MSPEQCEDTGKVDSRTDIYSLAVVLYEALAARPPHESESGTQLMLKHLTEEPVPLGELCPELPAHIEFAVIVPWPGSRTAVFRTWLPSWALARREPVHETAGVLAR